MLFDDLVGFEATVAQLKVQLSSSQLHHTYLFVGPEGIGKRSLCKAFAQAILVLGQDNQDGIAAQVDAETYPDLTIVEPDLSTGRAKPTIKIDQVREMISGMGLSSHAGGFRVALVDQADKMTAESQHACLKFLEEPPEACVLLLSATSVDKLPATVVSRCHVMHCTAQGIAQTQTALSANGLSEEAAQLLSVVTGGRYGLALGWAESGVLEQKNAWMDQIFQARKQRAIEMDLSTLPRQEMQQVLDWWVRWWRDLLILKADGEQKNLIHQDRYALLAQQAPLVTQEKILEQLDFAYGLQQALQRNASPKSTMAALLAS